MNTRSTQSASSNEKPIVFHGDDDIRIREEPTADSFLIRWTIQLSNGLIWTRGQAVYVLIAVTVIFTLSAVWIWFSSRRDLTPQETPSGLELTPRFEFLGREHS